MRRVQPRARRDTWTLGIIAQDLVLAFCFGETHSIAAALDVNSMLVSIFLLCREARTCKATILRFFWRRRSGHGQFSDPLQQESNPVSCNSNSLPFRSLILCVAVEHLTRQPLSSGFLALREIKKFCSASALDRRKKCLTKVMALLNAAAVGLDLSPLLVRRCNSACLCSKHSGGCGEEAFCFEYSGLENKKQWKKDYRVRCERLLREARRIHTERPMHLPSVSLIILT